MAMSECNEFLGFVNKTFDAWAWPMTVLALVWPLRHSLEKLIGRVKSLEGAGVKAEFHEGLQAASAVASGLEQRAEAEPEIPSPAEDSDALAANPTGVVMEAWKEVEQAARLLLEVSDPALNSGALSGRYVPFVNAILKSPAVDSNERRLFNQLRDLRNLVAHTPSPKISKMEVERYVALASQLASIFIARANFMKAAESPPPQGD